MATTNTDLVRKIKQPKKILVIILVILGLATIFIVKGAGKRAERVHGRVGAIVSTDSSAAQLHEVIITDVPYEVKVPFGKTIHFQLVTEDVPWWVRVNGKTVHERPPVNSPEYASKSYGDDLRKIQVWVDSGRTARLSYYFVPART